MPSEQPTDGVKAIRATLNAKLLKLNADLTNSKCNYDFTLDRINEIAKTLKKLPKEEKAEKKQTKAEEEESSGSFLDNKANTKRSS